MLRLGRWKSTLALILLLHLLVHPALHLWNVAPSAESAAQKVFRGHSPDPDDVCSLCRAAGALAVPEPVLLADANLHSLGSAFTGYTSLPRTQTRYQQSPRAPPLDVQL